MNLGIVLAVLLTSVMVTAVVRRWGAHLLVDVPNHRSSHSRPTPRGGGIGVIAGVVVGGAAAFGIQGRAVLWPVLAIALLSLADDLRGLSARVRLAGHIAIAAAAVILIGPFIQIAIPPVTVVRDANAVLALSMLWLVGMANLYNFLDGVDGLATAQAIIAGIAWWIVGRQHGIHTVSVIGAVTAVACLGFLPFNWQPARMFLGDVGSASLGMIFGVIPVLASRTGMVAAAPVGVLILWPFLFDGVFTVIRRARRKERLLEAHRSHLYQRLVIAGWSHAEVTTLYALFAVVSAAAAVRVAAGAWAWGWGAAVLVGAAQWYITIRAERRSSQRAAASGS